jgi:hypothetical protein
MSNNEPQAPEQVHVRVSERLVRHIVDAKLLFFPMLESIMTDPNDGEKPGAFLELFPHPLSRLYLTLLWKINREQDGDAVVLSNVWLREFARLDEKSLRKYRSSLQEHDVILSSPVGNGRQHLYRIANPRTSKPLDEQETDAKAIVRLSDPDRGKEVSRQRAVTRWKRKINGKPDVDPTEEPPSPPQRSSWDDSGW